MPRILILEDNEAVREMMAEVLTRTGYRVDQAADGKHALRLISENPVDLVITDIVMPDQDGLETITQLRKTHPTLPVIAMSGDAPRNTTLYLSLAEKLGVVRTLTKPFDPVTLMALVKEVLSIRTDAALGETR